MKLKLVTTILTFGFGMPNSFGITLSELKIISNIPQTDSFMPLDAEATLVDDGREPCGASERRFYKFSYQMQGRNCVLRVRTFPEDWACSREAKRKGELDRWSCSN